MINNFNKILKKALKNSLNRIKKDNDFKTILSIQYTIKNLLKKKV